jgi:hypothetical protein
MCRKARSSLDSRSISDPAPSLAIVNEGAFCLSSSRNEKKLCDPVLGGVEADVAQGLEHLALVLGEREDAPQLADERIAAGMQRGMHAALLLLQAGARRISQLSAPKIGCR